MIDRYETFVGWRYLLRRRRSRAVLVATIAFALEAAVLTSALLLGHFAPGSS